MSYCLIDGIGVNMSNIRLYLDAEKIRQYLEKKKGLILPDEEQAGWVKMDNPDRLDCLEECREQFCCFADILAEGDLLTYEADGDAEYYVYFEKSYPWERKEEECESREAAESLLLNTVLAFTLPEVTADTLKGYVRELKEVGYD